METSAESIKKANRDIYNNISPENYDRNESIFNEERRCFCTAKLTEAADCSGNAKYLDIGTGTGNLIRIASDIFERCYAVDIGENLLLKIKDKYPGCHFAGADAENIPFRESSFNCVSCYALLHHLMAHEKLFSEVFRVLKDGGTLYTDHDPNYFFNRFYHLFYKMKYRKRPGFGSLKEELAEYHNTMSSGINPEKLKSSLMDIGFKDVQVIYRVTSRGDLKGFAALFVAVLSCISKHFKLKSFNTHFSIIAIK